MFGGGGKEKRGGLQADGQPERIWKEMEYGLAGDMMERWQNKTEKQVHY